MSEHTYPSRYPPGTNWATNEGWKILDRIKPGVIDPEVRAFLCGMIAGTLMRVKDGELPMKTSIGSRVGVILGTDNMVVNWLGYGTYQGEQIPPTGVGGYNYGLPTPKLVLDNGDVVWGCESWWGSEADIKAQLEIYRAKGYTITTVSIVEARNEAKTVVE